MAPTLDQRVAGIQSVMVDYWEKKTPDLLAEAHPFGDWLVTKGTSKPQKTWKMKIQTVHSSSQMMRGVATDTLPGADSMPAFEEVTRTMRMITSRIKFLEDLFLNEDDPIGRSAIETINREVDDHMKGMTRQLIHGLFSDKSGKGILFEIPYDTSLPNSYAIGVEVPVDPDFWAFVWPGHIISIHGKNSEAVLTGCTQVRITGKKQGSTTYAGYPYTITLDTALTGAAAVPTGGAVAVSQGSYGYGLESLYALLKFNGTYMGLNPLTDLSKAYWNPFQFDAQNADIDLVKHVGPTMEELFFRNPDGEYWMILHPVQQYKLEAYIRANQNIQVKPLEMKGGWVAMTITIRGKKLNYIVDRWWPEKDAIPIIARNDLFFHYWGDAPIYIKKRGGGSQQGKAFLTALTESSVNSYAMDLMSYPSGILTERRDIHAKIINCKTS